MTPATSFALVCLSAVLGEGKQARVPVVGAGGTAGEIIAAARLEEKWSFVAADPSLPMLDLARTHLIEERLVDRVEFVPRTVADVDASSPFGAAIMIGVLHHLSGDAAKQDLLTQIASRLQPGAPLIVAGNYRAYASQPLFLAAWANRWRMNGLAPDEIQSKMSKILQGAEPPRSEEAVNSLLTESGFEEPARFFASLFWGAWLARRIPTAR